MMSTQLRFLFACLIGISSQISFAQTDSTDLTFETGEVVYDPLEDSLAYSADLYSNLTLSFEISDTLNFHTLKIEIFSFSSNQLILNHYLSKEELIAQGYFTDWLVEFTLPYVLTQDSYKSTIVIEDANKLEITNISKIIEE